jgi:hypothetical protein
MADKDRVQSGILGDIRPVDTVLNDHTAHRERGADDEDIEAMEGGSQHDRTQHSETGGTRNYRTGTGATGGDIGNRPE